MSFELTAFVDFHRGWNLLPGAGSRHHAAFLQCSRAECSLPRILASKLFWQPSRFSLRMGRVAVLARRNTGVLRSASGVRYSVIEVIEPFCNRDRSPRRNSTRPGVPWAGEAGCGATAPAQQRHHQAGTSPPRARPADQQRRVRAGHRAGPPEASPAKLAKKVGEGGMESRERGGLGRSKQTPCSLARPATG